MHSPVVRLVLFTILLLPARADEFDRLRMKWRDMLTGGEGADSSIPQVRQRLASIESEASKSWKNLQKEPGRRALWTDLADALRAVHMSQSWRRLGGMGLAWATPGQRLYHNEALLADLRAAMGWLEQNRYNARVAKFENWWHWEIGAPIELNDLMVLLYNRLGREEVAAYTAAIDRFATDPRLIVFTNGHSTGANRVWKCRVAAVNAIVTKNAAKLQLASDALGPVFAYVTRGDGFYEDGSFLMHGRYPYNGGYGKSLIEDLAGLMYLLADSRWEVRDARRTYALLPLKSSAEVAAYAAAPDFRVIANSEAVHAIAAPKIGLRAANFWSAGPHAAGGIKSDSIVAVVVRKSGRVLEIGVADPTQAATVAHIELDEPAATLIEKADAIRVDRQAPTVRLTIDLKNTRGRTLEAKFASK